MIPTTLAILIYQILAILGAEAVSQIVISIAYKRRELDYKLMYSSGPLDLVLNFNKFDRPTAQKASIVFFVCLTIVLKFIPTIMTKLSSSASIYHDISAAPLDPATATSIYSWPSNMPVFDNFIPYLANPSTNSLEDMVTEYIKKTLNQNTSSNHDGYWFTPKVAKRFEWDDQQVAHPVGFYAPPVNGTPQRGGLYGDRLMANVTANVFRYRNPIADLFTTSKCSPSDARNVVSNFSQIHGATVEAARQVLFTCHPMYDSSLVIQTAYHTGKGIINRSSRLNANDTLYRLPELPEGITASSSFGVSIFNHNSTHMTLGIKKTAHVTMKSQEKPATLPSDCTSTNRPNTTNNFVDLPYDSVLCSLLNIGNTGLNKPQLIQALSRVYVENYALDTLYTRQKDDKYMMGHLMNTSDVLMADFTLFQSYNVEGNLKDNREYMVAFSTNNLLYDTPEDIASATDFTNDKIGIVLKALDPSRIDQDAVDILVGMASMRVRWQNGDYSDILLNKAQVMDGVETPLWWIIAVSAMALIFLLPQISRLIVRRIPEYSENLRNLLLLAVERSSALEGMSSKAKNVGILLSTDDNEAGRTTLLSVNGHPVTVAEKSTSLERRSTDERTTGINESYEHPDGSVPFLK
ncbi:hypothetical protein HMPREF1544_01968 [Mucor circinelloides 1006PhL]|uniref:Uncharacterized protein n=1 Tax=Mucor circinelloides f. circinelloides (strain 1006PhL) TaxID=1220926 RepID=S2K779_MUCC1|nr:hypothetical protein HMPREF1544_01968 [Mucor circinelloides 1006PhL]